MSIEVGVLVGFASAILGMILGYANWQRNCKKDIQDESVNDGKLRSDINYIKRGVDDIKVDLKVQERQLGALTERVTRVEESSKQAHKRIDCIKE